MNTIPGVRLIWLSGYCRLDPMTNGERATGRVRRNPSSAGGG